MANGFSMSASRRSSTRRQKSTPRQMSNSSQIVEISEEALLDSRNTMEKYMRDNNFPIPTLDTWFRGAIIEKMSQSPMPDTTRKFYPGRVRLNGSVSRVETVNDSSDGEPEGLIWACIEKTLTESVTTKIHYFKKTPKGPEPVRMDTPEFRAMPLDEWTTLVSPPGRFLERGPYVWKSRINLLVRIALLLAGYYDGPASMIDSKSQKFETVHVPTFRAIQEHLELREVRESSTKSALERKRTSSFVETDDDHIDKRIQLDNRPSTLLSELPDANAMLSFFEDDQEVLEGENQRLETENRDLKAQLVARERDIDALQEEHDVLQEACDGERADAERFRICLSESKAANQELIKKHEQQRDRHRVRLEWLAEQCTHMFGMMVKSLQKRENLSETESKKRLQAWWDYGFKID